MILRDFTWDSSCLSVGERQGPCCSPSASRCFGCRHAAAAVAFPSSEAFSAGQGTATRTWPVLTSVVDEEPSAAIAATSAGSAVSSSSA